jgi:hypothetical protein
MALVRRIIESDTLILVSKQNNVSFFAFESSVNFLDRPKTTQEKLGILSKYIPKKITCLEQFM